MSELPTFTYHPDPLATGSVVTSDAACLVCGKARGFIYTGAVFAEEELDQAVCPWCIADGSAAERHDAEFVDVDEADDDVPEAVLDEIAHRTPGFSGWQDERWLFHCGDGAEFLGPDQEGPPTAYRFRCRHCGTELSYSDTA